MGKSRKQSGFSAVEIAVSLGLGAIVLLVAIKSAKITQQGSAETAARLEVDSDLFRAYEHIVRVGRLAGTSIGGCLRANPTTLECHIDFTIPRSAVDSVVRFTLSDGKLLYQAQNAGNWQTKITYQGVTQFEICDDTEMKGPCQLEPKALSVAHDTYTPSPNRFFRFRLTGQAGKNRLAHAQALQAAFFVRNPAFSDASYQWGGQ